MTSGFTCGSNLVHGYPTARLRDSQCARQSCVGCEGGIDKPEGAHSAGLACPIPSAQVVEPHQHTKNTSVHNHQASALGAFAHSSAPITGGTFTHTTTAAAVDQSRVHRLAPSQAVPGAGVLPSQSVNPLGSICANFPQKTLVSWKVWRLMKRARSS